MPKKHVGWNTLSSYAILKYLILNVEKNEHQQQNGHKLPAGIKTDLFFFRFGSNWELSGFLALNQF